MTVVMVAPALVKIGVPVHVAHLLVFYFAVLSEVSPPVGLSPSAAAAVTGGNPFGSMMQAWKYSLPAFLVPFLFSTTAVGHSLLIVDGNWLDFLLAATTAVCSLFFVSLGVIGYLREEIPVAERVLLTLVALAMVISPLGWSIQGLAPPLAGGLLILHHLRAARGRVRESGVSV
jgi:TRAP-type uncharacterized transport system fused permease subunit